MIFENRAILDFFGGESVGCRNRRTASGVVASVAFSSDGNLVSGSDDYLDRVWDANTGEQLKDLEGQNSCQIGSTSDDNQSNYKK